MSCQRSAVSYQPPVLLAASCLDRVGRPAVALPLQSGKIALKKYQIPIFALSFITLLLIAPPACRAASDRQEEGGGSGSAKKTIALPPAGAAGPMSLEAAIQARRTVRRFVSSAIKLEQLGQLLWAAQGITDPYGKKRAVPSGGALYPLDCYVVVGKDGVVGLEPGAYLYRPGKHAIESVARGERRPQIAEAALGQAWIARAPVLFVITAEYRRITVKYRERGVRYALIEVGSIAQNLFLQAEALGLGAGIVGAFEDKEVARLTGAAPGREPLLIMPVGIKEE